jgi:hypothetical protein
MEKAEKQKAEKAKDVRSTVEECIRAGMNFSKTKKELKSRGINYPNLSKTFYQWQEEIHPEDLRGKTLGAMKETKENKKKPLLPTPKAWNKQKQKEADECVFADVLNEALFYFTPCPQQGLKIEDLKQINLGGGIVGVVTYYTNVNLNHPVIVLVTRAILMVLKVRQMCYVMQDKYNEIKKKAREFSMPGVHSP